MKIEGIKKLSSGKYKIELSNQEKITTYDEVILKNNLLFQKELTSDMINQLQIETGYYDIYHQALKYVMTKMRSKKELYQYLEKKEVPKEEQERIMDDLEKIGVVNDLQFVKAFVSDKVHLSNMGPYKIRKELENHEIEQHIIDEELLKYSEEVWLEKLKKIINKKIKSNNKYSSYHLKQKVMQEMIDLGYSKDQISNILNEINIEDNDALQKELTNIYRRLSEKYEGENLIYQIKQKLYQKGFSMSDIKDAIEKMD